MNQLKSVQNPWRRLQEQSKTIIIRVNEFAQNYHALDITQIEDINYLNQAINLANDFQGALLPAPSAFGQDALRFDINRGLDIARTFVPKVVNVEIGDKTVEQTNKEVSTMINSVTNEVKNLFGFSLTPSVLNELEAAITDTFTNLNVQKNAAWIFWGKETAFQTNYTYNILFAVQNAQTGLFMQVIPMGFEISAYAVKERVLWFTIKDYATYNVKIQALKVEQPLIYNKNNNKNGIYTISNVLNNKNLLTVAPTSFNGIDYEIFLSNYTNDAEDKWLLNFDPGTYAYQIHSSSNPNFVLAWNDFNNSNQVFLTKNNWKAEHFWFLEATEQNVFYFINWNNTQKLLTVDGSKLIVQQRTENSNQKFLLNKIH